MIKTIKIFKNKLVTVLRLKAVSFTKPLDERWTEKKKSIVSACVYIKQILFLIKYSVKIYTYVISIINK